MGKFISKTSDQSFILYLSFQGTASEVQFLFYAYILAAGLLQSQLMEIEIWVIA